MPKHSTAWKAGTPDHSSLTSPPKQKLKPSQSTTPVPMAAATITKYQLASSGVLNPNGGRASYTRKHKMLTTWDYFSAHYRREYGKEPDMDNQNHVLFASWFVVGASDQAFIRSRVSESDRLRMICDCKDSAIRWVDANRPHPAIVREGWFCMGCLTEFIQHNSQINKPKSDLPKP